MVTRLRAMLAAHEGAGGHVPPGPRDDHGGSRDKRPRRWPGRRLARDCRRVLPPADEIKFMIMTAGGVSDPYCHPLATPMS